MEPIGKSIGNNISKIVIITSASEYISIKFAEQRLHILNNKDRLNLLKGSTKIQNRESLFKYQSRLLNVQKNNDVKHIGMKLI